jgi:hypothetical protein
MFHHVGNTWHDATYSDIQLTLSYPSRKAACASHRRAPPCELTLAMLLWRCGETQTGVEETRHTSPPRAGHRETDTSVENKREECNSCHQFAGASIRCFKNITGRDASAQRYAFVWNDTLVSMRHTADQCLMERISNKLLCFASHQHRCAACIVADLWIAPQRTAYRWGEGGRGPAWIGIAHLRIKK